MDEEKKLWMKGHNFPFVNKTQPNLTLFASSKC